MRPNSQAFSKSYIQVKKQIYKLNVFAKQKIYNIIYILLLKQNIIWKKQINKLFLEPELDFESSNNKNYKVKTIKTSTIYAKKIEKYLISKYYLVFYESYSEKKIPRNFSLQSCIYRK